MDTVKDIHVPDSACGVLFDSQLIKYMLTKQKKQNTTFCVKKLFNILQNITCNNYVTIHTQINIVSFKVSEIFIFVFSILYQNLYDKQRKIKMTMME